MTQDAIFENVIGQLKAEYGASMLEPFKNMSLVPNAEGGINHDLSLNLSPTSGRLSVTAQQEQTLNAGLEGATLENVAYNADQNVYNPSSSGVPISQEKLNEINNRDSGIA